MVQKANDIEVDYIMTEKYIIDPVTIDFIRVREIYTLWKKQKLRLFWWQKIESLLYMAWIQMI
ncbi:hypothetical protein COB57_03650 [Candidatus Peregrinibacteria bacterium]|nr:MAG: hypothetical protein COB57_03650 [Candidatus Peregrinibacteria bacterium]